MSDEVWIVFIVEPWEDPRVDSVHATEAGAKARMLKRDAELKASGRDADGAMMERWEVER